MATGSLEYRVIPLPTVWPKKATPAWARKRPQFKTIWTKALDLLDREIYYLGGKNVTIAIDVEERFIRPDGQLYASARPRSPAVIVSFDTARGRLQFPCDTFGFWQENVDAIARSMEKLRAVDRYGVTTGEQFSGFKAIPASTSPTMNAEEAARHIAQLLGMHAYVLLQHAGDAQMAIRRARQKVHPDVGGSNEAWHLVELARKALSAHFGREL